MEKFIIIASLLILSGGLILEVKFKKIMFQIIGKILITLSTVFLGLSGYSFVVSINQSQIQNQIQSQDAKFNILTIGSVLNEKEATYDNFLYNTQNTELGEAHQFKYDIEKNLIKFNRITFWENGDVNSLEQLKKDDIIYFRSLRCQIINSGNKIVLSAVGWINNIFTIPYWTDLFCRVIN